jgi:N-formylglutamate amidohydrolase
VSPGAAEGAWTLVRGEGPIVAVALHDGHEVRSEVAKHLALSEIERLREEDPRTADWVGIAPTHINVHRSRFEVDLNRPLETAVYRGPDQAWNLQVWRDGTPPPWIVEAGREIHRAFYSALESLLRDVEERHGRFVVYDLHSYNHRRGGQGAPADDVRASPDVNLGTGSMDRERWKPVVEAFLNAISGVEVAGRRLDVGENVRFQGGFLPEWVHRTFPGSGCALAVEVKKFFMDEWTGAVDADSLAAMGEALARTVPPIQEALGRLR